MLSPMSLSGITPQLVGRANHYPLLALASGFATNQMSPVQRMTELGHRFSLHMLWNEAGGGSPATLAASVQLYGSADPRVETEHADTASASWVDVSALITGLSAVTSGLGQQLLFVEGWAAPYMRLGLTYGSGTGSFKAYLTLVGG